MPPSGPATLLQWASGRDAQGEPCNGLGGFLEGWVLRWCVRARALRGRSGRNLHGHDGFDHINELLDIGQRDNMLGW